MCLFEDVVLSELLICMNDCVKIRFYCIVYIYAFFCNFMHWKSTFLSTHLDNKDSVF